METALFLHGQESKMLHESPCKHSNPFFRRHALVTVNLDSLHTAARGITLKDKTKEPFFFKFKDAFPGPLSHAVCQVLFRMGSYETGRIRISHQSQRFPWDRKSTFHLRADRDI